MRELWSLNKYLLRYKYRLFFGIAFVVISNIFAIYPAQVVRDSFDLIKDNLALIQKATAQQDIALLKEDLISKLLTFSGIILLMALLKGLFMFLMRQTIIVMSRLIENDLKNELYEHYQRLPISFYKQNNTGDLMNRISEDVGRVRMYVGPAIMYIANLVAMFVLVIYTMLSVNPKLTFYVLIPLPLLSFIIYRVSDTINKKSEQVQAALSNLSSLSQETFSGIRILKGYAREEDWNTKFEQESENYRTHALSLAKTDARFSPAVASIVGLSSIIIVFVGGSEVLSGNVSAGNIAEFIIYINLLIWPVTSLGWVSSLIQRASASQRRINEFLNTKPEIVNPSNEAFVVKGDIEFKNVSFTYPDTKIQALKNVSFKIKQGESLGIIGKTGSGKSTLAQLLLRVYDINEGEILIDSKNITQLNLNDFRRQTGYVPQEVFLFSDSITNNICFGLPADIPLAEKQKLAEEAAKTADVYSNIMDFPNQFGTVVGERGIMLSGGQKQRISIARAIIKKPAILILDDCLSAVDAETENTILQNLKGEVADRTAVIISHRVSSVKNANSILVMEEGRIVEQGTHEELMSLAGYYYELSLHQGKGGQW